MNKRTLCLRVIMCLVILSGISSAQEKTIIKGKEPNTKIAGKITDAGTGEPLMAVSVFLSGTTYGRATDKNGNYELTKTPYGQYELVVSMVGYSTEKKTVFLNENSDLIINVKLVPKEIEAAPVEVSAKRPDDWYDNLKIFKEGFLGKRSFSKECKIENEEDIYFLQSLKGDTVKALTAKPLVIINNALGYKLKCSSVEYVFYKKGRGDYYNADVMFEDIATDDTSVIQEWKENREKAYKGSMRHFLVSITKGKAKTEGFRIYREAAHISPGFSKINEKTLKEAEISENEVLYYLRSEKRFLFLFNYFVVRYKDSFSNMNIEVNKMFLDENGYPLGSAFFKLGREWADSGIADLLPRFYEKIYEKTGL